MPEQDLLRKHTLMNLSIKFLIKVRESLSIRALLMEKFYDLYKQCTLRAQLNYIESI